MDRKNIILEYISDELLEDPDEEISADTSLFQGRVLDSLNMVSLIRFLEETFNIKIKTSEVTVENLDSVEKMLVFLDKKTAA
jgi:acyl carrier protein